jgi:hypothetical protein
MHLPVADQLNVAPALIAIQFLGVTASQRDLKVDRTTADTMERQREKLLVNIFLKNGEKMEIMSRSDAHEKWL